MRRSSIERPRRQVVRIVKNTAPTASGIQPPLNSLPRLAAKKVSSTVRNTAAPGITSHSDFRHSTRNTVNASSVLVAKMALSATP